MMKFRPARQTDIDRIMELILQAKAHLKRNGVDQWQKDYPDRASIQADTASHTGYVMTDGTTVAGYLCVSFDGEETYEHIDGAWISSRDFAVIHRMAIDDAYKGRGLAGAMLEFAETLCLPRGIRSLKVDTDVKNHAMRHILEKSGYQYCGIIYFDNSSKLAFEKLL